MKKVVCSILVLALLFNISGHLFLFLSMQSHIKNEAKSFTLSNVPAGMMHTFSFAKDEIARNSTDIRFNDEGEFVFEGCMYDIVSKEIKGDHIILKCVNDKNEESLISKFISDSGDNFKQLVLKTLKIFSFDSLIYNSIKDFKPFIYILPSIACKIGLILNFMDHPDPPPKISL